MIRYPENSRGKSGCCCNNEPIFQLLWLLLQAREDRLFTQRDYLLSRHVRFYMEDRPEIHMPIFQILFLGWHCNYG